MPTPAPETPAVNLRPTTIWHTGSVLLVFDGDCGFCTRSAQWMKRRLPDRVRVEPWQSLDLDEMELSVADVTGAAWWIESAPAGPARGHEAIGHALVSVGGIYAILGQLIIHRPVSWLAGPVYALVARNRHRMPKGTPTCEASTTG